jgi:hypothetical protein
MNVDQELIVNQFVEAIGGLRASAGDTPQHASADETPQHASADETPLQACADEPRLRAIDKRRPDRWRQIATWSLASIALLSVWMLGILSLDWLGGSH